MTPTGRPRNGPRAPHIGGRPANATTYSDDAAVATAMALPVGVVPPASRGANLAAWCDTTTIQTLRAVADVMSISTSSLAADILRRAAHLYRTGRRSDGLPVDWGAPARESIIAERRALAVVRDQLARIVGALDSATRVHHCPECGARYRVEGTFASESSDQDS